MREAWISFGFVGAEFGVAEGKSRRNVKSARRATRRTTSFLIAFSAVYVEYPLEGVFINKKLQKTFILGT
jgi:hypothetical protein